MERVFIEELDINKVRHLKDIVITLSNTNVLQMKHLLLTGKNGSGKTSVLEALTAYLDDVCTYDQLQRAKESLETYERLVSRDRSRDVTSSEAKKNQIRYQEAKDDVERFSHIVAKLNLDNIFVKDKFYKSEFILAYFNAERSFEADVSKHVEKVTLKDTYSIYDQPRKDFVKYLVDKKISQSLYQTKNDLVKAKQLEEWFQSFEELLREVFEDHELTLDFDVDTFEFHILEKGREPFDFNTMSAGYAAVLDIAASIIMRMDHQTNGRFMFDMPGIVLIDEVETHLHYELQKKVLPFLCKFFPNIQFVVSTHSAFVLNSIPDAVIYDLETHKLVKDGLQH